jgi:hypothetical protein
MDGDTAPVAPATAPVAWYCDPAFWPREHAGVFARSWQFLTHESALPEPGGLCVRHLLDVLHRQTTRLVGADVVELNPDRDVHGMTAGLAAKLVEELAGMAGRR